MKKTISLILILSLVFSLSINTYATQEQVEGSMNEQEQKVFNYMRAGNLRLLCLTNNYWYMQFVNEFRANALDMYLLTMTDKLIDTGVEPDKELYTKVLITLMTTYEMDNASNISEQKKLDNTKDLKSYFMDAKDIVAKTVSVIAGNNSSSSQLEEYLSGTIGILSTQIDNVDNWIEGITGLDTILENYETFDEILSLLIEQGNGELKAAASDLKNSLEKEVQLRIKTYSTIQDENFNNNFEDFIFNGSFLNAVQLTDEYENNENIRFLTDESKEMVDKISLLKDSWELGLSIGKLIGNLTMGAEDLIYRTRESMAICDISKILQSDILNRGNEFYSKIGTNESKEYIEKFVQTSEFLIQCRFRGEYNIYSIITSDAKLASILNQENNEETTRLYNKKLENIIGIQEILNNILTAPIQNEVIEIADYLENPEQLIDMLGMETTSPWQFPDGDTYIKDNFYLELYNDLFSVKNEGADYITLYGIKVGDSIETAIKIVEDNGWKSYYSNDGEYAFLSLINDKPYLMSIGHTGEKVVASWYLNNWPQGEDIYDVLNGNENKDSNIKSIFESMPSSFAFSSGAGGWATQFTLEDDGSFSGQYVDTDMGDVGSEYPGGTVYISNFTGKFTTPIQINDYTHSMRLENLQAEGTAGEEYYENGQRFIYSDPYGFDSADEFLIYTPGAPMADLPEGFKSWLLAFMNPNEEQTLPYYGIYNVGGEEGFVGFEDTPTEAIENEPVNQPLDINNIREQVISHYTELWQPKGTYVCYEDEDIDTGNEITFVLRYIISDEEAQERIANGGTITPNALVTSIVVNKETGEVYDKDGFAETWTIEK